MKLLEIPINERPRERLFNEGCDKLSNEELLSIILKTGTKDKSVKEYLISKQIREAVSLSAGSLLLADNINNKNYDKKTKPWLIGLSITAWGASIINNLTAYYNYKKENNSST